MIFGTEDVLPVYGFLKLFLRMAKILNDYLKDDDDDYDDFGYHYRDNTVDRFKQDLYNKTFSLQDQGKCDKGNTLKKRDIFLLNVINMCGPRPDNVYDYDSDVPGTDYYFRGAESDPEIGEFKRIFRDNWQINQLKIL